MSSRPENEKPRGQGGARRSGAQATNSASVSVIIPCYNGEAFLAETLKSAIGQTVQPLEILVIDDGSTDRSAEIAESFGPPVRVLRQPNRGESVARNRGIDEAKGEWIAFLDADDLWLPEKLEQQLARIDDSVVAVHTNVETFGMSTGVTRIESEPPGVRYSRRRIASHNCFVTPSALAVRRSHTPRFVEWARRGEDMLFVLDLVSRGEIRLVEEPLTRYRRHAGGQAVNLTGIADTHQALVRWLEDRKDSIDASERHAMSKARLEIVIRNAWGMKARRRWDEYWIIRNYLNEYARNSNGFSDEDLDEVTSNRIYPRAFYWVRDLCAGGPPFRANGNG